MKFVDKNIHLIKDDLLPIPPLFELIQSESGSTMKEMFQVFNMGHRLEAYTSKKEVAEAMVAIAKSFNIDAKIIGRVESSENPKLTIVYNNEKLEYYN